MWNSSGKRGTGEHGVEFVLRRPRVTGWAHDRSGVAGDAFMRARRAALWAASVLRLTVYRDSSYINEPGQASRKSRGALVAGSRRVVSFGERALRPDSVYAGFASAATSALRLGCSLVTPIRRWELKRGLSQVGTSPLGAATSAIAAVASAAWGRRDGGGISPFGRCRPDYRRDLSDGRGHGVRVEAGGSLSSLSSLAVWSIGSQMVMGESIDRRKKIVLRLGCPEGRRQPALGNRLVSAGTIPRGPASRSTAGFRGSGQRDLRAKVPNG